MGRLRQHERQSFETARSGVSQYYAVTDHWLTRIASAAFPAGSSRAVPGYDMRHTARV
jgi:hypothetical protein